MNPPLPEPADYIRVYGNVFTEAQVLAYRAEVIEMCAKVCEQPDNIRNSTFEGMAEEIRSLK